MVNGVYLRQTGLAADPGGLSFWTTQIAAGNTSLAALQAALANSPAVGTAMNTLWLNEVGSPIDSASKTYFVGQFAGGNYGIADLQAWLATTSAAVTAVTNLFQQNLGRPPSASELAATQANLASGFTTLAALRTAAAYLAEARNAMTATYNAALGRNPTEAELQGGSANLASGFSTQASLKFNAAYSAEAQDDITATYNAALGRNPTATDLANASANLASGATTQQSLRMTAAYSTEAQNDITATYRATLERNPSAAELAGGSANLASGATTQQSLKLTAADSQEALNVLEVNSNTVLGQGLSVNDIINDRFSLENGSSTQQSIRASLAESPAALNNLNNVFTSFVGLVPDPGAISVAQNDLAQGASIAQATNDLLASDSFQESLQFGLEQTLQDTLPINEVAAENYVVQQDVIDLAPITWQSVASTVGSSIINFLESLNPIGTAEAATTSPQTQQINLVAAAVSLTDPRVVAFLHTITQTEGADYNILYGGRSFPDNGSYPGMTSGAYQIIPSTYAQEKGRLGLSDFSHYTQDLMGADLLVQRGITDLLYNNDLQGATAKAALIWSSFPVGSGPNDQYSFYNYSYTKANIDRGVAGLPQPSKSYDTISQTYQNFLSLHR